MQKRFKAKKIFGVPCSVHNVRFREIDFDVVFAEPYDVQTCCNADGAYAEPFAWQPAAPLQWLLKATLCLATLIIRRGASDRYTRS